jgi:hypothetical protein
MNQDWNDPKSKLQQCCLTLRSIDGGEPDIPIYKSVLALLRGLSIIFVNLVAQLITFEL